MNSTEFASARNHAYDRICEHVGDAPPSGLREVVDLAWEHLKDTGVSWLGFYRFRAEEGDLVLDACRDRPACSPIGLHGVCGQSHRSGRTRIVRDVAVLGDAYVACDPRDRSELVIPCRGRGLDGRPADYVLDLDSTDLASFSDEDDRRLRALLAACGLEPRHEGPIWMDGVEENRP